jgi:hypothetical protein
LVAQCPSSEQNDGTEGNRLIEVKHFEQGVEHRDHDPIKLLLSWVPFGIVAFIAASGRRRVWLFDIYFVRRRPEIAGAVGLESGAQFDARRLHVEHFITPAVI